MASFDFIDVSVRAYEFFFSKAHYLMKVAIPVMFIKLICYLGIFVLGYEEMFWRQGLVLLPSFLIEGLFIAGLIRYIVYNEPIFIWGRLVEPGERAPDTENGLPAQYIGSLGRTKCLQAGIAVYTLTQIVYWGIYSALTDFTNRPEVQAMVEDARQAKEEEREAALNTGVENTELPSELSPDMLNGSGPNMAEMFVDAVLMFAIVVSMIWVFRLFWLYIPAAMGVSMRYFLHTIRGLSSSILLFVTWFSCRFPTIIVMNLVAKIFLLMFPDGSAGFILLEAVLRSVADVVIVTVTTIGLTFGIFAILSPVKKK